MASSKSSAPQAPFLIVGLRGSVVALRRDSGEIAWSTKLRKGAGFVPVVVEDGRVYATDAGEVSCLDARTGKQLWHNSLKGFGLGPAVLAGADSSGITAAIAAAVAAAAAANAAAAAAAG